MSQSITTPVRTPTNPKAEAAEETLKRQTWAASRTTTVPSDISNMESQAIIKTKAEAERARISMRLERSRASIRHGSHCKDEHGNYKDKDLEKHRSHLVWPWAETSSNIKSM